MPRPARPTLITALIALHAALTLGGPGLHALPGLGHDSGLRPLAKNDHSHGPGKSAHEAADDCPVCQFLAQGQIAPDPAVGAASWLAVGVVPPAAPPVDVAAPLPPFIPRGPPTPA